MRGILKAAALTAAGLAFSATASAGSYSVQLNKTELLHLPESAAAVVVGNPNIADVSVHSSDTLFVLGRGYGSTNIIVLNSLGQTILNADVHVGAGAQAGQVRIFNGSVNKRQSFSCHPYCLPSPILGDSPDYRDAFEPETKPINNPIASGAATGAARTIITRDSQPPAE